MTTIFFDGFDKYGDTNTGGSETAVLITQNEWTVVFGILSIVAPLSVSGYALSLSGYISKSLSANYSRIIGGVRVNSPVTRKCGVVLMDGSTAQCTVGFDITTGYVTLWSGNFSSILYQSNVQITANTTHYLEWDVSIGPTATYSIWLDGALVHTGTANTQQSSNAYMNTVQLSINIAANFIVDDFYLFSASGASNNSALLSNPRVETDYPIGDHQTQFTNIYNIVGYPMTNDSRTSIANNYMYLIPFTPNVACGLSAVHVLPTVSDTGAEFIPVLYSDLSGAPNSLLASGAISTGATSGLVTSFSMASTYNMSAGTQYWLGFISTFTTLTLSLHDAGNLSYRASAPLASGAPSTAPVMTANQPSIVLYGTCVNATTNWESVNQNPVLATSQYQSGTYNLIEGVTVGTEDLYVFPAPSSSIVQIYSVAMKTNAKLSTAGSRSISLNILSGATNSQGSLGTQALSTSFNWYASYYDTDPNTGSAWLRSNLAAAYGGQSITA